MATLHQFQKRLSKISSRESVELTLFTEIKRFENIFIRLQREQISKGETNEGTPVTGSSNMYKSGVYKSSTENYWAKIYNPRKPKVTDNPYNFEWTGAFLDGLELNVVEDSAQFWSKDGKTKMLVAEFKGLFGLQDEKLKEVISRVIYPAFMQEIREVLKLK